MENLTKHLTVAFIFVLLTIVSVWAGQNSGAGIRIDLNSTTYGNQNQTSIPPPGTDTFVRIDIYVINASNLDTYEFNLNYNTSQLQFIGGAEDQPLTFETNFLKKNGGSTTGFTCTAASGVVNCANTLVGNQGDNTPDGEGILASIVFKCLVDAPDKLTFGDVHWYDNNGVHDVCTDKGEASLPVELFSFTAVTVEGGIILKWTTQSEVNNLGFNIYRSLKEGEGYTKINEKLIEGAGTSSVAHSYTYKDKRLLNDTTYWYKIEDMSLTGKGTMHGPISITTKSEPVPTVFKLSQSYPNPFNPTTTIRYQLPEKSLVNLKIYNILGQLIRTLVDDEKAAGYYTIQWDGRDDSGKTVGSGIYFYRLEAGSFIQTRKALFLR